MKLNKLVLLTAALFAFSGCQNTAKGIALTTENAATYIDLARMSENTINAEVNGVTVSFSLYPNVEGGKLFSENITGKCSFTVKYSDGSATQTLPPQINWSEASEVNNVSFVYKKGEGDRMDSLEASYTFTNDNRYVQATVYNLKITEISGNMKP